MRGEHRRDSVLRFTEWLQVWCGLVCDEDVKLLDLGAGSRSDDVFGRDVLVSSVQPVGEASKYG